MGLLGVFFALLGVDGLVALALFGLATAFATRQLRDGLPVAASIGYGAGLLGLCELVSSAATLRRVRLLDRAVVAGRLAALTAVAVVGAAAAALALVGSGVHVGAALLAASIGLTAAVLLLAAALAAVTR